MRKNLVRFFLICGFFPIFILLVVCDEARAENLAEILRPEISGEIRLNADYDVEPSSKTGDSAFRSPGMEINIGMDPASDLWVQLSLQAGPSRDTENGKWNLQLSSAYAEFLGVIGRRDTVRYGLIPNLWVEYGDAIWGYRWNCDACSIFVDRYNYVPRADLGVSYRSPWAFGFWSLSVTNGEGLDQEERGGGKDFQVMVDYLPWGLSDRRRLAMALSYIRGTYEGQVDPSQNKKERILVQVHFLQRSGFSVILEGFWGVDPVDAINKKVADQVDLTDQGGQIAHSQGWSALLKYGLSRMEIFARHNQLNPMRSVGARGLREDLLGFGFFPRQNLQFSLAWSQVRYDSDHSVLVRDSQKFSFSTQIGF